VNIVAAIGETVLAKWEFYQEKRPTLEPHISEAEDLLVSILLLGTPFLIDSYLWTRCIRRHGDIYVPADKLKR
jgi:hypothetical protein